VQELVTMPRAKTRPGKGTTQSELDRLQAAFFQEQHRIAQSFNSNLRDTREKTVGSKPKRPITLRRQHVRTPLTTALNRGAVSDALSRQCVHESTGVQGDPVVNNRPAPRSGRSDTTTN